MKKSSLHSDKCSKSTLDPKGRNVILQKAFGKPKITKDGVTVAKEIELEEAIEKAVETVVLILKKQSKEVGDSKKKRKQIASISANNDEEIGQLISIAFDKVGKEGVLTVEEAKGIETKVDIVEGMQFDRGFQSPYFVTNMAKMITELDKPYILLADPKLATMKEVIPVLAKILNIINPY